MLSVEPRLSPQCFGEYSQFIHLLTGITIASNRNCMLESRLRRRLSALDLETFEDYLEFVRNDLPEQSLFIDQITTNETYFFRTQRIWDYLEQEFLSGWLEKHPKKVFSAWSAAASSGEEAYSLGAICQKFRQKHPGFAYQIMGTDLSERMVKRGNQGHYKGRSIEKFKTERSDLFRQCMHEVGDGVYEVIPEIRSRIRFRKHNLLQALPGNDHFDLVLLRNVLIYFRKNEQELSVSHVSARISPSGVLIIGESESLNYINTPFTSLKPLIYTKGCHPSS
jgi:chemotaxis protein methyltransferase CheR